MRHFLADESTGSKDSADIVQRILVVVRMFVDAGSLLPYTRLDCLADLPNRLSMLLNVPGCFLLSTFPLINNICRYKLSASLYS